MLDAFAGMITYREANLLEFLAEPRTLDDIVAHRFVYRPGTGGEMVDQIERRSMSMHLERLLKGNQVKQQGDTYEVVA
jgi:hypothetical protein